MEMERGRKREKERVRGREKERGVREPKIGNHTSLLL